MSDAASTTESDDPTNAPLRAVVSADAIQTTVSLANALFEECHLYFDGDGIRLSAIDAATIASARIELDRAGFESYEATEGHVGVDLSRFGDVVGMADSGQPVELVLDTETRKLVVRIGGLEYTLALVDPDTVRSPPDQSRDAFEFAAAVSADAADFDRAITAADMVSDHLALGVDEDAGEFYVEADGDTDDVSLALSADDLIDISPGDARSLFSVDYLDAIDRATPRGTEIEFELGAEQPVALAYEYADGAGSVEYLVAPRISRT